MEFNIISGILQVVFPGDEKRRAEKETETEKEVEKESRYIFLSVSDSHSKLAEQLFREWC